MHTAETVLGLLVVALAVASFAERLNVPVPSLLVSAGIGVGLIPHVPAVRVAPGLVSIGPRQELKGLRRDLIAAETAKLSELVKLGVISNAVRTKVQRTLDLEDAHSAE